MICHTAAFIFSLNIFIIIINIIKIEMFNYFIFMLLFLYLSQPTSNNYTSITRICISFELVSVI
jgi:hypothetical protein